MAEPAGASVFTYLNACCESVRRARSHGAENWRMPHGVKQVAALGGVLP